MLGMVLSEEINRLVATFDTSHGVRIYTERWTNSDYQ